MTTWLALEGFLNKQATRTVNAEKNHTRTRLLWLSGETAEAGVKPRRGSSRALVLREVNGFACSVKDPATDVVAGKLHLVPNPLGNFFTQTCLITLGLCSTCLQMSSCWCSPPC